MTGSRTRHIPLQTPGIWRSLFSWVCPNLITAVVLRGKYTPICKPLLTMGTPFLSTQRRSYRQVALSSLSQYMTQLPSQLRDVPLYSNFFCIFKSLISDFRTDFHLFPRHLPNPGLQGRNAGSSQSERLHEGIRNDDETHDRNVSKSRKFNHRPKLNQQNGFFNPFFDTWKKTNRIRREYVSKYAEEKTISSHLFIRRIKFV